LVSLSEVPKYHLKLSIYEAVPQPRWTFSRELHLYSPILLHSMALS